MRDTILRTIRVNHPMNPLPSACKRPDYFLLFQCQKLICDSKCHNVSSKAPTLKFLALNGHGANPAQVWCCRIFNCQICEPSIVHASCERHKFGIGTLLQGYDLPSHLTNDLESQTWSSRSNSSTQLCNCQLDRGQGYAGQQAHGFSFLTIAGYYEHWRA